MEKYRKIIARTTPIISLIQQGVKPEDIKKGVIETLEPFFENQEVLTALAVDFLIANAVVLETIKQDAQFFEDFKKCLSAYRSAKDKQPQKCYESIALLESEIDRSVSKFWSVVHLEVDKSTLEIDEFLHECLRNIGDSIEELSKPYLKSLLLQLRLLRKEENFSSKINAIDLGKIIDELIQKSNIAELFMPTPWKIRLNQWRNIARHGTAKTVGEGIVCWYGVEPKITEVRLSRADLLKAVETMNMISMTLKLAYSIFTTDNVHEVRKHLKNIDQRPEADFVAFVAGLASQGFEIIEYSANAKQANLKVKDHTNLDRTQRRIHASQLLFPLWYLTKSKSLVVEYLENDDSPNSEFSICSDILEMFEADKIDLNEVIKNMRFVIQGKS